MSDCNDNPVAKVVETGHNILDYVIDIKEAAELWGLSTSRIRQLAIEGKIKAKKIGKEWAIDVTQDNPKTYRTKRNK